MQADLRELPWQQVSLLEMRCHQLVDRFGVCRCCRTNDQFRGGCFGRAGLTRDWTACHLFYESRLKLANCQTSDSFNAGRPQFANNFDRLLAGVQSV